MVTKRAINLLFTSVLLGYCALVVAAYFQLTPPSSQFPDLRELGRLLLHDASSISRVERLLEASGDTIESGTMRPAFTVQSTDWVSATKDISASAMNQLLAEREGERLALLDWVRSGASRQSYEMDDYPLRGESGVHTITAAYQLNDPSTPITANPQRVRLRTLITDRCVPCHSDNGRHDTARFIPLDTYDRLAPRLQPQPPDPRRKWLLALLAGVLPLAALIGLRFWHTNPICIT